LGRTDGARTEVSGEAVQEGMGVVTGEIERTDQGAGGGENPFAPKMFGGKRGS
jgi:hypothetical protein